MEDVVMFGEEGKEDKNRICVSKVCNRLYDCEKILRTLGCYRLK
jgi:hypothetical protein